jgi:hypothetical protein
MEQLSDRREMAADAQLERGFEVRFATAMDDFQRKSVSQDVPMQPLEGPGRGPEASGDGQSQRDQTEVEEGEPVLDRLSNRRLLEPGHDRGVHPGCHGTPVAPGDL